MTVFGVDLGSHTSRIARFNSQTGKPEPLSYGHHGANGVPSLVAVDAEGRTIVGTHAKHFRNQANRCTRYPKLQLGDLTRIPLGKGSYHPQQLAKEILDELRRVIRQSDPNGCADVVIAIPGTYEACARKALEEAAEDAGFNVLGLVHEHAAAAIGCTYDALHDGQKVVILDAKADSWDVTCFEVRDEGLVRAGSLSFQGMGGDAYCEALGDLIFEEILNQSEGKGGNRKDGDNPELLLRLSEIAEDVLILLDSADSQATCTFRTWDGREISLQISDLRKRFDKYEKVKRILAGTKDKLRGVFNEIGIDPGTPLTLVFIGGASRIACLRDLVSSLFGKGPLPSRDPRHAVADGAAVYAAIMKLALPVEENHAWSFSDLHFAARGPSSPADLLQIDLYRELGVERNVDKRGLVQASFLKAIKSAVSSGTALAYEVLSDDDLCLEYSGEWLPWGLTKLQTMEKQAIGFMLRGEFVKPRAQLEVLCSRKPDSLLARYLLAKCLLKLGKWPDVHNLCNDWRKSHPAHANLRLWLQGQALLGEAEAIRSQALLGKEGSAKQHTRDKLISQAIECFDQAARQDRTGSKACFAAARAYELRGLSQFAQRALNQGTHRVVNGVDYEDASTLLNALESLLCRNRLEEARDVTSWIKETIPDHDEIKRWMAGQLDRGFKDSFRTDSHVKALQYLVALNEIQGSHPSADNISILESITESTLDLEKLGNDTAVSDVIRELASCCFDLHVVRAQVGLGIASLKTQRLEAQLENDIPWKVRSLAAEDAVLTRFGLDTIESNYKALWKLMGPKLESGSRGLVRRPRAARSPRPSAEGRKEPRMPRKKRAPKRTAAKPPTRGAVRKGVRGASRTKTRSRTAPKKRGR